MATFAFDRSRIGHRARLVAGPMLLLLAGCMPVTPPTSEAQIYEVTVYLAGRVYRSAALPLVLIRHTGRAAFMTAIRYQRCRDGSAVQRARIGEGWEVTATQPRFGKVSFEIDARRLTIPLGLLSATCFANYPPARVATWSVRADLRPGQSITSVPAPASTSGFAYRIRRLSGMAVIVPAGEKKGRPKAARVGRSLRAFHHW